MNTELLLALGGLTSAIGPGLVWARIARRAMR